ncbi:hypothetical protein HDE_05140 [Halotydeus destructor]|nr:hypothetical protein HDE_05140 [Halotydeus destructor]
MSSAVESGTVQQVDNVQPADLPLKCEKKTKKGFKIPFFGKANAKPGKPETEAGPEPGDGSSRRRTSSVGHNDVEQVQRKKSGNLGKYKRDIDPEPRSTPNF